MYIVTAYKRTPLVRFHENAKEVDQIKYVYSIFKLRAADQSSILPRSHFHPTVVSPSQPSSQPSSQQTHRHSPPPRGTTIARHSGTFFRICTPTFACIARLWEKNILRCRDGYVCCIIDAQFSFCASVQHFRHDRIIFACFRRHLLLIRNITIPQAHVI